MYSPGVYKSLIPRAYFCTKDELYLQSLLLRDMNCSKGKAHANAYRVKRKGYEKAARN